MSQLDTLISDGQRLINQGQDTVRRAQGIINDPVGSAFEEAAFWTALTPKVALTAGDIRKMMSGKKPSPPAAILRNFSLPAIP